jgi:hypothetical protein
MDALEGLRATKGLGVYNYTSVAVGARCVRWR